LYDARPGDRAVPFAKIDSSGPLDVYFEEEGTGDPVVLIGGFSSTIELWWAQRPRLAHEFRVILPDNRGSGRTRIPHDDGWRGMERFAGDVRGLLDALGLERVHLVGASMGGMIVQQFAVESPERLRSLSILCSRCGGADSIPAAAGVGERMERGAAAEASDAERRAGFEVMFHRSTFREAPEVIERMLAQRRSHPHTAAELARRGQAIAGWDVSDVLRHVAVPTLVMTGDADELVPPGNSDLIARLIPGAELVRVADAGHCFFQEKAAATNAALLDFLRRH
jgi:pimeloyl-ACP methyl ester carboxylesterase